MRRFLTRLFARPANPIRRRPGKLRPRLGLETLDERLVPSTLHLPNDVLTYDARAGVTNNLTVAHVGSSYVFIDTAELIDVVGIPGATGSGTNTVVIPDTEVPSGGILINLFDRADVASIESTIHAITVKAGDASDTVDVGKAGFGNLGVIDDVVTVDGEAGLDVLRLNDQNSNAARFYGITSDTVSTVATVRYIEMDNLTLSTGIHADTFSIESTAAITRTSLNSGDGGDAFVVGGNATMDDIQGVLFLDGGTHGISQDMVYLDDTASTAHSYTFRLDNFIARTGSAMVSYTNVEDMHLSAGNFGDSVAVLRAPAGMELTLQMNGGDDAISFGSAVNSMDTIATAVRVLGGPGTDSVHLNDTADDNGNSYVIDAATATDVTRNSTGILSYSSVDSLTLTAGQYSDGAFVRSTGAATPLTLRMGEGDDGVLVGNASQTLDQILGAVTVLGLGGSDRLTVNDRGDFYGYTGPYTVTPSTVQRPSAAPVNYASTESLTVHVADVLFGDFSPSNEIFVTGTLASTTTTTIYGAGNLRDVFTVGSTGNSLDTIQGALTLIGQDGVDELVLNDHGDSNANSYVFASTRVSRAGSALISHSLENTFNFPGGVTLNAAGSSDTVVVRSTAASVTHTLNVGAGGDAVTVGAIAQLPLAGILSAVVVNGQAGTDSILVSDADFGAVLIPGNNYTITSTDVTRNARKVLVYDSSAESLALVGSTGGDTITVASSLATTPVVVRANYGNDTLRAFATAGAVALDGEGHTDVLDYSLYVSDVRVNLELGTATGVSVVANIENVTGGYGNDILVGDAQSNTLLGGFGRDILIGRGAADQLNGQEDDDVLIGGFTAHDLSAPRLEDLMREWSRSFGIFPSPLTQYNRRVDHLLGITSGGLNGTTTLDASQVSDDGASDYLDGDTELDWFIAFGPDTFGIMDPGERIN